MLDSTDAKVLELGLKWSQGKSILNSINLEDGEERFASVVPLAQRVRRRARRRHDRRGPRARHGRDAAAKARDRAPQLHAPDREVRRRAGRHLLRPARLPVRHGRREVRRQRRRDDRGDSGRSRPSSRETRTILGISNVSFGLPEAGREVLNSVFLYHATKAGLDLAIVNTEKIVRYPSIPEEERRLSEDLIWNRGAGSGRRLRGVLQGEGRRAEGRSPSARARRSNGCRATSSRAPRKASSTISRPCGSRERRRSTSSTVR